MLPDERERRMPVGLPMNRRSSREERLRRARPLGSVAPKATEEDSCNDHTGIDAMRTSRRPSRGPSRRGASARRRVSRRVANRRLLFATGLVALVAATAWFATQVQIGGALDRDAVIERAQGWVDADVPYSQTAFHDGYRTDCSGFVSMAWGLPENLTTWRIPLVATEISKDDLLPGDILLDYTSDNRHVVIFERWANTEHSAYWALECSGHPEIDRAIRRVVPYPYVMNESHYLPYRYKGMTEYLDTVPESERQPVESEEAKK